MQKVQVVNLRFIDDIGFLKEQYESMGFSAKIEGEDMLLYWGKPKKVKKPVEEEKKPYRRSKTERRLNVQFVQDN